MPSWTQPSVGGQRCGHPTNHRRHQYRHGRISRQRRHCNHQWRQWRRQNCASPMPGEHLLIPIEIDNGKKSSTDRTLCRCGSKQRRRLEESSRPIPGYGQCWRGNEQQIQRIDTTAAKHHFQHGRCRPRWRSSSWRQRTGGKSQNPTEPKEEGRAVTMEEATEGRSRRHRTKLVRGGSS